MTTQRNEADDFLLGSGTPSFSFDGVPPITVRGKLKSKRVEVVTDFDDPSIVLTWSDGSPRKKLVLTLETTLTNGAGTSDERRKQIQADGEDDGVRDVHMSHRAKIALAKAMRAARANVMEEGAEVSVTYTRDGEKTGRGKAPKEYAVTYTSPADSDVNGSIPAEAPATVSTETPDISSLSPDLQDLVLKMAGKK